MEIEDYVSQYTPRRNATEGLKQDVSDDKTVENNDNDYTYKQGVMFGNDGLSYSSKMLKECARKIQNRPMKDTCLLCKSLVSNTTI